MIAHPNSQSSPPSSDVAVRTVSALVLAPVALALVWWGGLPFLGLMFLVAILMSWEWTRLIGAGNTDVTGVVLYGAVAAGALGALQYGYSAFAVGIVLAGVLASGLVAIARKHQHPLLMALGPMYVVLPVLALFVLRRDEDYGFWCVIWLLVVIWSTDTGAYFVGRTLGGPKVAPAISPKKTWSGCIGGTICAFAVGVGIAYYLDSSSIFALGAVSVAISVLGQIGDFLESGVKRRFDVKDTSNLIPGHGGVLDRLDSLIVAGVGAWALGAAIAGSERAATGLLLW